MVYRGQASFENANLLGIARELDSGIPQIGSKYQRMMTEVSNYEN
jgi:hypothetical protein